MNWKSAILCGFVALLISAGAASGAEIFVTANPDNTFTPADITINVGDTVTWTNAGGLHNVEALDGSFRCANGCDGDGMGGDGNPATNPWTASVTFTEVDVITYVCIVHVAQNMVGTITVVDDGGPALTLEMIGDCPGDVTLSLTGATPNGGVAFALAAAEGVSSVPVGNCAGTDLGLDSPSLLTVLSADGDGEINFVRTTTANNCGRWLQAVDTTSCGTSNTEQIP